MKKLKYEILDTDSINTSESYSKDVFYCDNIVLIPYINMEIVEELGAFKQGERIDFSYLILLGVQQIQWDYLDMGRQVLGKLEISGFSKGVTDYFALGGLNHLTGGELKITFEKAKLVTLLGSKTNKKHWVPQKTPNLRRNLQKENVERFLNDISYEDEIGNLIGNKELKFDRLILSNNTSDKEALKIHSDWTVC